MLGTSVCNLQEVAGRVSKHEKCTPTRELTRAAQEKKQQKKGDEKRNRKQETNGSRNGKKIRSFNLIAFVP